MAKREIARREEDDDLPLVPAGQQLIQGVPSAGQQLIQGVARNVEVNSGT